MTLLDMARLPVIQEYTCESGDTIDMCHFLGGFQTIHAAMADLRHLKDSDSFGFSMLPPLWNDRFQGVTDEEFARMWDDPYDATWFTGGWGEREEQLIANAVRKQRVLLRHDMRYSSTMEMALASNQDGMFRDQVTSDTLEWGDFPYGGAVWRRYGPLTLIGACSGYKQFQDHIVMDQIFGCLAQIILTSEGVLT